MGCVVGMDRRTWERCKAQIDEAFDAAARRVVFDDAMGADVLRRLANEDGLGKAPAPEKDKQQRMW